MGAWKWWSFTVQLSFFLRGTIKALSVGFIILYDVGSHCFQDYITLVVTLWIMENLNSCKNFFYLNYLKSLHFNKKWNILVENNKIGLFYQNLQTYYIPEYFFYTGRFLDHGASLWLVICMTSLDLNCMTINPTVSSLNLNLTDMELSFIDYVANSQ